MSKWPIKTIGDLTEVVTKGATPTSVGHKFTEAGINFVKVETIRSDGTFLPEKFAFIDDKCHFFLKRSQLVTGDILFSIAGALGRTAFVSDEILPANTNQALAIIRLRPSEHVLPAYVMKALSSGMIIEQIERQRGGVAQQNLSLAQVKGFAIPLPSLPEQKRIVAILDEAFAGIDKAIANIQQNLANARELFESYLNSIFTQKNEGWPEQKLGDVFDITSSKRILEKEWTSAGVPFYGGKEIVMLAKSGTVLSNAYISEEKYRDYASKYDMPRQGDILITARGTIGVGYIVKTGDKFYYKDGNIISMRGKTPTNPRFILYAFRSNVMASQLGKLTGTTVRHLPIQKAKELALRMPEVGTQNSVVEQIQKLEKDAKQLEAIYQQKLTALAELKQSLLKKAFSGELTADELPIKKEATA